MNKAELDALKSVINYMWDEEAADFERDITSRHCHIFNDLVTLNGFINNTAHIDYMLKRRKEAEERLKDIRAAIGVLGKQIAREENPGAAYSYLKELVKFVDGGLNVAERAMSKKSSSVGARTNGHECVGKSP